MVSPSTIRARQYAQSISSSISAGLRTQFPERRSVTESRYRETLRSKAIRKGYASPQEFLQAEIASAIKEGRQLPAEDIAQLDPQQRERLQSYVQEQQRLQAEQQRQDQIQQAAAERRQRDVAAAQQRQQATQQVSPQGFNVSLKSGQIAQVTPQGEVLYSTANPAIASPSRVVEGTRLQQERKAFINKFNVSRRTGQLQQVTPQGEVIASSGEPSISSPAPITAQTQREAQFVQRLQQQGATQIERGQRRIASSGNLEGFRLV